MKGLKCGYMVKALIIKRNRLVLNMRAQRPQRKWAATKCLAVGGKCAGAARNGAGHARVFTVPRSAQTLPIR